MLLKVRAQALPRATAGLLRAVAGLLSALLAACASLPDTDALIQRHAGQTARFESARGPLSARRSAAIVAQLKSKSGDLDILD